MNAIGYGRSWVQHCAVMMSLSLLACTAQTESAAIGSDEEAAVKLPEWRRLDYSRCYTVLQELGSRPEYEAEVAALQSEINEEGLTTGQVICTHVGSAMQGLSPTIATAMSTPDLGLGAAIRIMLVAIAGIAAIATVIKRELLRDLIAGMLLDDSVQSPVEIARVDINATYEAVWATLPFESQESLAAHKEWLKDMLMGWITTFSNSIDAKRAKPGTKYCYAVVFGDNVVARDTWDYAVSDCAVDARHCPRAQNEAAHNMRLKQSGTPSIGIYYNACHNQTGFFVPTQ